MNYFWRAHIRVAMIFMTCYVVGVEHSEDIESVKNTDDRLELKFEGKSDE